MRAEIIKEFTFEAAHHLPGVGARHKCARLHGHLYRVEVCVAGEIDEQLGWIMDFGVLAAHGKRIMDMLDHQFLNEVPGLDCPTSEQLATFIFDRFHEVVPTVVAVTVHESPTSRCTYRPHVSQILPFRTYVVEGGEDATFAAAHSLLYPPDDREPVHGHDYVIRAEVRVTQEPNLDVDAMIRAFLKDQVAMLNQRFLFPAQPVMGRVETKDGHISLILPQERITLPIRDVVLLDMPNVTAEYLAGWLAKGLRDFLKPQLPTLCSLTLFLREGPSSWASVTLTNEEQDAT